MAAVNLGIDIEAIRLAVQTKLLVPPLSARSTEPGSVKIGEETYDPALLAQMLDVRLTTTPITDLMFDG